MSKRILVTRVAIVYLLVIGLLLYLKNSEMDYFATLDPGRPKIETGYGFINKDGFSVEFNVTLKALGNHPFSEYGVVFLVSEEIGDFIPGIEDEKFVFKTEPRLGRISEEHGNLELIIRPGLHVYYRAYILLDSGQAIYGDIKYLVS